MELAGMMVRSFRTPHDSRESTGYRVSTGDGRTLAVATDMGHMTEEVRTALWGCDLVMIESNHDIRMLENGPYPYVLKRRILASTGHLSNDACSLELPELIRPGGDTAVSGASEQGQQFPGARLSDRAVSSDGGGDERGHGFCTAGGAPHRFGTGYGVLNVITVKSGGSLCAATSFLRAEKGYKEATNGASPCNLL